MFVLTGVVLVQRNGNEVHWCGSGNVECGGYDTTEREARGGLRAPILSSTRGGMGRAVRVYGASIWSTCAHAH